MTTLTKARTRREIVDVLLGQQVAAALVYRGNRVRGLEEFRRLVDAAATSFTYVRWAAGGERVEFPNGSYLRLVDPQLEPRGYDLVIDADSILDEVAADDEIDDEHPTPATAVDLIRDALALVDGLADEVLPRIRRGYVLTAPQHVDAVRDVEQKVAEAWAALTMARTWLEDIR